MKRKLTPALMRQMEPGKKRFSSAGSSGLGAIPPNHALHRPYTNCNVFSHGSFMDPQQTFFSLYGVFPCVMYIGPVDVKRAMEWVEEQYHNQIRQQFRREAFRFKVGKLRCKNVLYLLEDPQVIIDIDDEEVASIVYMEEDRDFAGDFINAIRRFKLRERKKPSEISIVTQDRNGLDLEDIPCPRPKLNLALHYNDDLADMDTLILRSLREKRGGLYLLHGTPGTGKSTYIRHLVNQLKKEVIFISPRLAGNLDGPQLLGLLLNHRNSILVVEDAEDLLASREQGSNSAISILLNLTDGILGESLGIQVICTFNTSIARLDKALLRKGRLVGQYEFKPLVAEKAAVLLQSLGHEHAVVSGPMALADIFGYDEEDFGVERVGERGKIGFGVE